MTNQEDNKLTEPEMKLARLEQRKYIRENLKGGTYIYGLAGIDRDNIVDELEVGITEDGYDEKILNSKINEQNSIMELFALELGQSEEFHRDHSTDQGVLDDNKKALSDMVALFEFTKGGQREVTQEEPKNLTEHEQVIQKLEDLRRQQEEQNMNPYQKREAAKKDLENGLNALLGYK